MWQVTSDQMGRRVELPSSPQRIISIVPSQTELLFELGLGHRVVGITKFCIHPQSWFRSKTRIGGTKSLHLERIAALNPDLIIGNKEENEQSQIEWLAARFPVWMSDIFTLDSALEMIRMIGGLVNAPDTANKLADSVSSEFANLQDVAQATEKPLRAAYLIWREPWMAVGSHTFIHEMIIKGGFDNVFASQQRYPEITLPQLAAMMPDVVLLSSEPFPFAEKHIKEINDVFPASGIFLVDGELFSWYGSRLLRTPPYLRELRVQCRDAVSGRRSD